jgi:hypothetical protein
VTADELLRFSQSVSSAALVARLIRVVYPDVHSVLDLTPGQRTFWRDGSSLCLEFSPHDFRSLPYADGSFDLAVFDPPHTEDSPRGIMGQRYGGMYKHHELEPAVRAGVREAWRVGRVGALIKVVDAVHGQQLVRMSGWVLDELGEPYELAYQVRKRALIDPKWGPRQLSARNNGAVYLAYRRGSQKHVRR